MTDPKRMLEILFWAPILTVIFVGWALAAGVEVGYYYLKGYSWDSIRGGYWHRKTGALAR